MGRRAGSKNILAFQNRKNIDSTKNDEISHLSDLEKSTPLDNFLGLLAHQKRYLTWVQSRHDGIGNLTKRLPEAEEKRLRGPKEETFKKYYWYTENLLLLDAINAFEVFYKQSILKLAKAVQPFVDPAKITGRVDGSVLWATREPISVVEILFEANQYLNLSNVDSATDQLIGKKFYSTAGMSNRAKLLNAVFQIRHTLSHNHGLITPSDAAKFDAKGFSAIKGEVIDPLKNELSKVVRDFLSSEATKYTDWLKEAAASYLENHYKNRALGNATETIGFAKSKLNEFFGVIPTKL
jgi:hypothetical protein